MSNRDIWCHKRNLEPMTLNVDGDAISILRVVDLWFVEET